MKANTLQPGIKQSQNAQQSPVSKQDRQERFGHQSGVIWFTGLSGSGKSTSAIALENTLFALGYNTYLLDGDVLREGLCSDLGFETKDRSENIRRVAELAKLMADAGMIVLASFISPIKQDRARIKALIGPEQFIEVYVNTPLEECEKRDVKGLYKKARAGLIKNFTGIDAVYEAPDNADLVLDTRRIRETEVGNFLLEKLQQGQSFIKLPQDTDT